MTEYHREPDVRVEVTAPVEIETDLLVVPVFEDDDLGDLPDLDRASNGEIGRARARHEFSPKPKRLFFTPLIGEGWRAERVALLGAGPDDGGSPGRLRSSATALATEARRRRATRVAVLVRGAHDLARAGQCLVEGLLLGGFDDGPYKTERDADSSPPLLQECVILTTPAGRADVEEGVKRGAALGTATNLARVLVNEPSNVLTPRVFAERATALVTPYGMQVEVLDEDEVRARRMGLLLAVAQGSSEPPRLVIMRHTPPGAPTDRVLGLIGKGVTFDSGGISLKTPDGMERMKYDMAGGAAVVGAMHAIGALGLPIRTVAVVPMTENMPSGRATKPGDVLHSASGTTVEVVNTDAEGRLILADALWQARQLGATHVVDVATLTGACVVALGHAASGLFGHPESWIDQVRAAAETAGERVWPLPLYDDYREQLRSETADLANTGGRPAGACTAAAFLRSFAGDLPWAHLDVAGTAWVEGAKAELSKGATGVMTRTLVELASRVGRTA